MTNQGASDSLIGPESDELVIHRSGASLSRVLLRQGEDLFSVTVDPSSIKPAEVPVDGDDTNTHVTIEPIVNHHTPAGNPIVSAPATPTAPVGAAKDDSGCTISRSNSSRTAPGLALLGLALLSRVRRSRRGSRR